ncbi:hypothetical protein V6N13_025754 [Hibiscus sabdariffa]
MALLLLLHIALLSTLCAADDPYVSYDFKLSYITVSPLGVPQRSLQKESESSAAMPLHCDNSKLLLTLVITVLAFISSFSNLLGMENISSKDSA